MPENPLTQARFDHVDDAGRLVFASGDERFFVDVDETLERAILEAKQIREESRSAPSASSSATLPISQIQALIRAGADPARVAERYRLSEALVRRFSSAVEVEKQYAIEQFLTVPAPKESRGRTTADVVERALALSGIGMESVTWKATRRGLEPWKIAATFDAAGRTARAEWSWNMHDNAVACLNSTAKKLLGTATGARGDGTEGTPSEMLPATLPGDSVRSARIERTVSAWNTPAPTLPAARPEARMPRSASPLDVRTEPAPSEEGPSIDIPRTGALPAKAGEAALGATESKPPRPTPDSDTSASAAQTVPEIESESGKTSAERSDRQTACETPFGSLRCAQLGRDSLRRVGSSGPPSLSSETHQSFFTEKKTRQAVRIMRHRRDTFGIATVTPRQSGRECPFPAPSASHAHPADASPCRSGCANPRRSPSRPPIPARHRASA